VILWLVHDNSRQNLSLEYKNWLWIPAIEYIYFTNTLYTFTNYARDMRCTKMKNSGLLSSPNCAKNLRWKSFSDLLTKWRFKSHAWYVDKPTHTWHARKIRRASGARINLCRLTHFHSFRCWDHCPRTTKFFKEI